MPSYKGSVENDQCIISVHVHSPITPYDKEMAPEHFTALIDTGAQRTCVSQKLVSSLELIPESKTKMKSATAVVEVNQYVVKTCTWAEKIEIFYIF